MAIELTTYFDGGCPLCSREIAHYRRLDHAGAIRWVDITRDRDALAEAGLDPTEAMRRIHARAADGTMLTGVRAFVAIWRRLPRYRPLAVVVAGLRIVGPLEWAYAAFADWRFRRRCREGACRLD